MCGFSSSVHGIVMALVGSDFDIFRSTPIVARSIRPPPFRDEMRGVWTAIGWCQS